MYLKSTPTISADQEPIRRQAKEIVGDETKPLKVSELLEHWVFRHLRKTTAANASTALDVLKTLAGDCTEHTLLFLALARASGIPARRVGGVVYGGGNPPLFAWHAWAEIHDGSQWVSIDPTWDQVFVDATHLKLSEGSDDWSWVNVVGSLKIKILDFTSKK